jgi:hypothetical protein
MKFVKSLFHLSISHVKAMASTPNDFEDDFPCDFAEQPLIHTDMVYLGQATMFYDEQFPPHAVLGQDLLVNSAYGNFDDQIYHNVDDSDHMGASGSPIGQYSGYQQSAHQQMQTANLS